jgi:hypothetical protein
MAVQHDSLQAALRTSLALLEFYQSTEVAQPFVKTLTNTLLTWSLPTTARAPSTDMVSPVTPSAAGNWWT